MPSVVLAIIGIVTASLPHDAFASLARLAVFGMQPVFTTPGSGVVENAVNGSLWYDDDYNVFYNPAYALNGKSRVLVQKNLEGGWFQKIREDWVLGTYFNRGGVNSAGTNYLSVGGEGLIAPGLNSRSGLIGTATELDTQRPIDIFIAYGSEFKLGLHVSWAYNRDQTGATSLVSPGGEITSRYWHFDLGLATDGLEPFVGATVFSKYENTLLGNSIQQNLQQFNIGFRYRTESWTPYFVFKKHRESGFPNSPTNSSQNQAQTRMNIFGLGLGHDAPLMPGVHFIKNLGFWWASVEDDSFGSTTTGTSSSGSALTNESLKDYKEFNMPINLALEADLVQWFVLRVGGVYDFVHQRKYSRSASSTLASAKDRTESLSGNASFRVGSSLVFSKLTVDLALGNGAVTTPSFASSQFGFDPQSFAFVSASYEW